MNMISFLRRHTVVLLALACGALVTPACAEEDAPVPTAAQTARFKPSYAQAPAMRLLLHWSRMPVHVCFALDTTGGARRTRDQADWRRTALAGFDEWVRPSGGVIRYEVVDSPTVADVTVSFAPVSHLSSPPGAVGNTDVYFIGHRLQKAVITLAVQDVPSDEAQQSAAHEFGHALGIDGHSDNPDDLMFPVMYRYVTPTWSALSPSGEPARGVTTRDLNTLKTCYSRLFTATATASRPSPRPETAPVATPAADSQATR